MEYQLNINHSQISGTSRSVYPGKSSDTALTGRFFDHLYRTLSLLTMILSCTKNPAVVEKTQSSSPSERMKAPLLAHFSRFSIHYAPSIQPCVLCS
jgi:hypothetical protein